MFEALVVVGIVALIAAGSLVARVPWMPLFFVGAGMMALGLVLAPAAIGYHLRLRAALAGDRLPRRWWLNPTALHGRLTPAERTRVMPYFYVGATSFVLSVLGGLLAIAAALRID